ncbi:MAG: hypothetical protein DCC65_08045 [Planctomycetota bacterium]|nr:MAG: hypothetical protein DCC65_08045 [Planctomycetota bacterium]
MGRFALVLLLPVVVAMANPARAQDAFPQGVASGDVTADAVILWTRTAAGPVRVEVARDAAFADIVAQLDMSAGDDSDGTLKFDITGLTPSTVYQYRFVRLDTNETSPVGRFRTAPAAADRAPFRFVYTGDSNAEFQPFTILRHAAAETPDLWFWAGDTAYADAILQGLPPAVDLPGYRGKHRQNREDAPLRELLAGSPVWVQWDDHEVSNDYDGGDLEPNITRGQQLAGYQAFFEYQPIRPQNVAGDAYRTYRSIRYGALAEFFILDCRQYRSRDAGRDGGGPDPRAFLFPTLEFDTLSRLSDPGRTMLGAEQVAWLKAGLRNSNARWKFILSSLPFTSLLFLPYDRWDGYAAEKYDLLRYIDVEGITGCVLLSADIHGNVYNPDVTRFLRDTNWEHFSPCFRISEFIAGPIATDTIEQEIGILGARVLEQSPAEFQQSALFQLGFDFLRDKIVAANQISFIESNRFAYLVVEVTEESLTLTHRGIPADPAITDAPLETLSTVMLPEPPPQGCAPGLLSPVCMCLIAGLVRRSRPAISRRRSARRHRRS